MQKSKSPNPPNPTRQDYVPPLPSDFMERFIRMETIVEMLKAQRPVTAKKAGGATSLGAAIAILLFEIARHLAR